MAGSGVALRLHEFRESQDEANTLTPKTSRPGRDVRGLYPGQLGRVHVGHSKDCGSRRLQSLHESLQSANPPSESYQRSFDLCTLRALAVLHQRPAAREQRPLQTAYQDHFGLQAPLFPP